MELASQVKSIDRGRFDEKPQPQRPAVYQSEQLLQAAERSDSSSVTVFRFCSFSQLFHGNASFVIFL